MQIRHYYYRIVRKVRSLLASRGQFALGFLGGTVCVCLFVSVVFVFPSGGWLVALSAHRVTLNLSACC
jgi:hypothetical protein